MLKPLTFNQLSAKIYILHNLLKMQKNYGIYPYNVSQNFNFSNLPIYISYVQIEILYKLQLVQNSCIEVDLFYQMNNVF